jgi:hypothetical protein
MRDVDTDKHAHHNQVGLGVNTVVRPLSSPRPDLCSNRKLVTMVLLYCVFGLMVLSMIGIAGWSVLGSVHAVSPASVPLLRSADSDSLHANRSHRRGPNTGDTCAGFTIVGQATTNMSINMRSSGSYAVIAATAVTLSIEANLFGDIALTNGAALVADASVMFHGNVNILNAAATQALYDLTCARTEIEQRTASVGDGYPVPFPMELGGITVLPGVYDAPVYLTLTGVLKFYASGDPDAVWII